jgi:hypothetical protein
VVAVRETDLSSEGLFSVFTRVCRLSLGVYRFISRVGITELFHMQGEGWENIAGGVRLSRDRIEGETPSYVTMEMILMDGGHTYVPW